jgi:hypothetical protein
MAVLSPETSGCGILHLPVGDSWNATNLFWSVRWTITDDDGTPIDLTNYSVSISIQTVAGVNVATLTTAAGTVQISNPEAGIVAPEVPGTTTENWTTGTHYFEVVLTSPSDPAVVSRFAGRIRVFDALESTS